MEGQGLAVYEAICLQPPDHSRPAMHCMPHAACFMIGVSPMPESDKASFASHGHHGLSSANQIPVDTSFHVSEDLGFFSESVASQLIGHLCCCSSLPVNQPTPHKPLRCPQPT